MLDMVSMVFTGFSCLQPALKVFFFLLRPASFPIFSFGGGSVRFFLP